MSGLFGRTPLAFVFSSRALLGKLQPELSTTQPSSYRVPATSGRLPMQAETSSFALSRKTVCWNTYKTVYSNGPILHRYLVATSKASVRSVNRDRGARVATRSRTRNETDSSPRNHHQTLPIVSLCRVPNGIRAN